MTTSDEAERDTLKRCLAGQAGVVVRLPDLGPPAARIVELLGPPYIQRLDGTYAALLDQQPRQPNAFPSLASVDIDAWLLCRRSHGRRLTAWACCPQWRTGWLRHIPVTVRRARPTTKAGAHRLIRRERSGHGIAMPATDAYEETDVGACT